MSTAMQITDLLAFGVKNKASDLHISAGLPPMIRVNGDIRRINLPEMNADEVGTMISSIMNDLQRKNYQQNLETDFSFELPNIARFRVNAFNTNRGPAAVLRTIPSKVLTLEELKAPRIFQKIADNPRGLVLVTGPTGSGKSTTLAAMMDYVNEKYSAHILTIEDPIEFVHQSKKCLVNQRELGEHTHSFANALRSALREDPDIILVGEMRDPEKEMVRSMLSESLRAVIAQTLLKTKDGKGRVAAHEIMISTPAIRNLIRENKIAQMQSSIQTGQNFGMQTLDQCLQDLVRRNIVSLADARAKAQNPDMIV